MALPLLPIIGTIAKQLLASLFRAAALAVAFFTAKKAGKKEQKLDQQEAVLKDVRKASRAKTRLRDDPDFRERVRDKYRRD